jgi:rod shape-determining protein MreD
VKAAGALVAIALALALQTTLDRFLGNRVAVDLVLVAVVYVALTNGPVGGMFAGSLAGLIQDSLTTGYIGVGGLAKSVVGFFAGAFGQQFIVTAALPRLVMFLGATIVHAAVFVALYAVLDRANAAEGVHTFASPWRTIAGQALANAVVGMVAFTVIEAVPGVVERRRMARRGRH